MSEYSLVLLTCRSNAPSFLGSLRCCFLSQAPCLEIGTMSGKALEIVPAKTLDS